MHSLRARQLQGCIKLHRLSPHVTSRSKFLSSLNRPQPAPPSSIFRVSDEVRDAVDSNKPVVALETTIYTHGFPYPDNVALASDLESVVRVNGGIPATIGILGGVAKVGLAPEEMIQLCAGFGKEGTMKVSRRDLVYITGLGIHGKKLNGGTTIAGTMILAHMAGIEIFGTGGLGGVHRGGEVTMDVSADLTELGRTPVTVISSGPKSFLDIERTLEYLETQGVMVGTFRDGRRGAIELPAFYTRESGIRSPIVVGDEREAASVIYARSLLALQSGLFLANPIPTEFSIPKEQIDVAIEQAVQEAASQGIHGHANTPFILARIKELTDGRSIPANRALIESNVARATRVAVELSKLRTAAGNSSNGFMPAPSATVPGTLQLNEGLASKESDSISTSPSASPATSVSAVTTTSIISPTKILVAGSIAVDFAADYVPSTASPSPSHTPILHTSNPSTISTSIGGVGHNIATAAHYVSSPSSSYSSSSSSSSSDSDSDSDSSAKISSFGSSAVRLCSIIASDLPGKMVLSALEAKGMDTSGLRVLDEKDGARTAQYIAVNDANKDLMVAMADFRILSSGTAPTAGEDFAPWQEILDASTPEYVVVDANWSPTGFWNWVHAAKKSGAKVIFEPVSVAKSTVLFPPLPTSSKIDSDSAHDASTLPSVFPHHTIDLMTPNQYELVAMHDAAKTYGYLESQEWWTVIDSLGIPSSGVGLALQHLSSPPLVNDGIPQRMLQLLPFCPLILTKLGPAGVLLARLLPSNHPLLTDPAAAPYILSRCRNSSEVVGGVYMRLFGPVERVEEGQVVSVNGVGDTFAGVLVAGLARGGDVCDAEGGLIGLAQRGAVMSLRSGESVAPEVRGLRKRLEGLVPRRR